MRMSWHLRERKQNQGVRLDGGENAKHFTTVYPLMSFHGISYALQGRYLLPPPALAASVGQGRSPCRPRKGGTLRGAATPPTSNRRAQNGGTDAAANRTKPRKKKAGRARARTRAEKRRRPQKAKQSRRRFFKGLSPSALPRMAQQAVAHRAKATAHNLAQRSGATAALRRAKRKGGGKGKRGTRKEHEETRGRKNDRPSRRTSERAEQRPSRHGRRRKRKPFHVIFTKQSRNISKKLSLSATIGRYSFYTP